jgi:mono/diheme cytochrome c family protein
MLARHLTPTLDLSLTCASASPLAVETPLSTSRGSGQSQPEVGSASLGWRREILAAALGVSGVIAGLGLMAAATLGGIALQRAIAPRPAQPLPLLSAEPGPVLDDGAFLHGRSLFAATCVLCHGPSGQGVKGLGKDITQSEFVASLSDGGLAAFIRRGRDAGDPYNTTKLPMPPSGGNPSLTDADLTHLVVYLRGLQDPRRVSEAARQLAAAPPAPPPPPAPPTNEEKAAALAAAGGDAELAEFIAHGTQLFASSCSACHGKDARGMPKLGKSLIDSPFTRSLDDDALLAFLLRGRDPNDPLNTTKVAMPPKGGNPALSEDDLLDIIAYLRSIQAPVNAVADEHKKGTS